MLEAEDVTERESRHEDDSLGRRTVQGIVTAISRGFVEVATPQGALLCTVRGKLGRTKPAPAASLHSQTPRGKPRGPYGTRQADAVSGVEAAVPTRVAPGDQVMVLPLGGGDGVVEVILPRRSVLRRSAGEAGGAQVMLANVDHAVLVFAVCDPALHFGMLDRFLALCEHASIRATICLNKVDLGIPEDVAVAADLYRSLGYCVLETSALNGEHLAVLARTLSGRVSLMTGPSGVGKSSLISRLLPDAQLRVGAISDATGKGRHTTTGVRLLRLSDGGWLADSAGIRELALWNVPPDDLARCFVELRDIAGDCDYEDCEHGDNEEGCALRLALAEGRITPARFASFERLLREARDSVA
jgi:ribosome biogenesis GTPase / thiamine phosphate phosphatase